jgi:hypothetical protein
MRVIRIAKRPHALNDGPRKIAEIAQRQRSSFAPQFCNFAAFFISPPGILSVTNQSGDLSLRAVVCSQQAIDRPVKYFMFMLFPLLQHDVVSGE